MHASLGIPLFGPQLSETCHHCSLDKGKGFARRRSGFAEFGEISWRRVLPQIRPSKRVRAPSRGPQGPCGMLGRQKRPSVPHLEFEVFQEIERRSYNVGLPKIGAIALVSDLVVCRTRGVRGRVADDG